jgi:hypothetical protein
MSRPVCLWVGGWGLPPAWMKSLLEGAAPEVDHCVVPPTAAIEEAAFSRYARVGGFSLGTLLLLRCRMERPVVLLSPIFGYTAEMGLGGKVRATQVRYLMRWLERDPLAALGDFYQRARLDIEPPEQLPYPIEDLQWGLEQLLHQQVEPRLPEGWQGRLGAEDPFLDAARMVALEPRLLIVSGGGHDPASLLQEEPPR